MKKRTFAEMRIICTNKDLMAQEILEADTREEIGKKIINFVRENLQDAEKQGALLNEKAVITIKTFGNGHYPF